MASVPSTWDDNILVAALLALDPGRLGGVHVRGPSGPSRDAWLDLLADLAPKTMHIRRCPARIDEERLLGGLDLTASLATSRPVLQRGLLSETDKGIVIFTMAECLPTGLGAQVAHVMDQDSVVVARDGINTILPANFGIVLLDEGATDEERAPDALAERCAFKLQTPDLPVNRPLSPAPKRSDIDRARLLLGQNLSVPDQIMSALVETAFAFGIGSFRPVLFALYTAQLLAALDGRIEVGFEDANLAARLTMAHKATQNPAQNQPDEQNQTSDEPDHQSHDDDTTQAPETNNSLPRSDHPSPENPAPPPISSATPPTEMMIDIVKAALPAQLIAALMSASGPTSRGRDRDGRGSGDHVSSAKRGRPIGARRGALRSGQRIHLIDTLRAAAPWQKLRKEQSPVGTQVGAQGGATESARVRVMREDIRIRRFVEKRETTIVFAVDASGSSAWQRLSEAKGAVQLMLASAYQTRARVALVAFRNESGELILPPTRSLTRARRLLGDMVGGGGTPLASGLKVALKVALAERAKGRTARLLVLTDGQGNVALDGSQGRAKALEDALSIAGHVRASGLQTIHIDTSTRPRPESRAFADKMGARYAPLPSARSGDLAGVAKISSLL